MVVNNIGCMLMLRRFAMILYEMNTNILLLRDAASGAQLLSYVSRAGARHRRPRRAPRAANVLGAALIN